MSKNTRIAVLFIFCFLLFAPLTTSICFADKIPIPGGTSGGSGEITTLLNNKAAVAKTVFGVIIGIFGLASAGIGAANYAMKKWQNGHSWMIAAGVGLVVGSLITAYAQLWG